MSSTTEKQGLNPVVLILLLLWVLNQVGASSGPIPRVDQLEVITGRVAKVSQGCDVSGITLPTWYCSLAIELEGHADKILVYSDRQPKYAQIVRELQAGSLAEVYFLPTGSIYAGSFPMIWQIQIREPEERLFVSYDEVAAHESGIRRVLRCLLFDCPQMP